MQRFALRFLVSAVAVTFVASMGAVAQAPQGTPKKDLQPTVIYNPAVQSNPIAKGNNLYCAGFIQTDKFDTSIEIVGGDEEGETRHYEPGDYIYISTGSGKVAVGDEYSIIRPRGKMHSDFSHKGYLGVFATEVGLVKVVEVRSDIAIAMIT